MDAQPLFAPAEPPAGSLVARYATSTRAELDRYLAIEKNAPYLGELMAEYPGRGGKMMRPAICIANARIFGDDLGEDYAPAIRCAAAIEMLHNALLIHDDVQDGSEERRGRPTLHAIHGIPLAINAGDALMFSAFQPLLDAVRPLGSEVTRQVLAVTMTMARQTAEGQALELGWRDRNITDLTEADYLQMALKKTAWMGMIWPAQLGVIVGSAGYVDPEHVMRFGYFLGLAFQIEDDLRNLSDDPGYGKERNGDLFEGKRTLMLIHVRQAASSSEKKRIDSFMAMPREERSMKDVDWLAKLMRDRGSIDHAREVAHAMAGAALHEFSMVYAGKPPSEDLDYLSGLANWVFARP
ncbi:polyprenyl synthetase family protein [Qipengyuania sp. XHP0207]|uniref:polyprenyl synthetase family protein n=1 Tax=Qipengyuania sp. XHP0207 TaxID=3038078 RepID=UPI00241C4B3E|nr:polyprenyl synthetase family protein [Qipengyuania sp. XHP0207]MDG5747597.1 polyprenyl synthetase family protein [Qipengyuania sp. XHP0207]